MTYLHQISNQNNDFTESIYTNNPNPSMSMEMMAKIQKGTYIIWNRDTNEVVTVCNYER